MSIANGVPMVLLASLIACAPRGPVIGSGERPAGVGGTISGSVRAASDNSALSGRKVTAINLETGQRLETTSAESGGYTIKVPVGKYRLEVELRPGEALGEQPAELEITRGDMDAQRNFTITKSGGPQPTVEGGSEPRGRRSFRAAGQAGPSASACTS